MPVATVRPVIRPLALAALAAFSLAGCGLLGGGSISADDVEQQISDRREEQVGQEPDEVSCPEDLPAEEGAEMTCVLTAGGDSLDITVAVTSVEDRTVNFDIEIADAAN